MCRHAAVPSTPESLGAATAFLLLLAVPGAHGQCEVAQLASIDPAGGDIFGACVAIQGDLAVVGDPVGVDVEGFANVYRLQDGRWTPEAVLTSGVVNCTNVFGGAVAIDGDVVVVGDEFEAIPPDCWTGAVYVYRYDGVDWLFEAKLTALDGEYADRFGVSVAIDGDVILVGAVEDDVHGFVIAGSAYVFRHDGSEWVFEAHLRDPNAQDYDGVGWSVSLAGDVALVSGHGNDGPSVSAGAAFVFRYAGGQWALEQELAAPDATGNEWFSYSVALDGDGDTAVIGAPQDLGQLGSAYVFCHDGSAWVFEQKLTASQPVGPWAFFGASVAITDLADTIVIGAPDDWEAGGEAGAAYVFNWDGTTWKELSKLTAPQAAGGESYGGNVAVWEDLALISGSAQGGPERVVSVIAGVTGTDCNDNGEPDACDIAGGTSLDVNSNGIPDECECPWDLDGSGIVGTTDLLLVLTAWGSNPGAPPDFDADGAVGTTDLLTLLANWGACP